MAYYNKQATYKVIIKDDDGKERYYLVKGDHPQEVFNKIRDYGDNLTMDMSIEKLQEYGLILPSGVNIIRDTRVYQRRVVGREVYGALYAVDIIDDIICNENGCCEFIRPYLDCATLIR